MVNKLAKSLSAAAVFAMAAVSLAPQSALAGIGKISGPSINGSDSLLFDIDTSSPYISDGANQGTFTQAIPKASYQNRLTPFRPAIIDFNPGDLKISLIDLTPDELQFINLFNSSFKGKFDSKVVKYEARLEDNSNPKYFVNFAFYAPYIEPFTNLNSLSVFNASNLTPFLNPDGQVTFPKRLSELNASLSGSEYVDAQSLFSWTPAPDDVTKVPEPAATAGLLGFGIASIALLHKRNKRLEVSISHAKR
jgi:hypothetical protein